MKRNRPSGFQQRKIKKSKELARESLSGSILKYVAPSASLVSNTPQQSVESDLLDVTDDVETRSQDALDEGTLGREPDNFDTQDERQGEDQHQEEYDQEKGRNSDNEEKSQQIENDEEKVHGTTHFDVATWPTPMPDDLRVEIVKAGSEPYQNRDGPFVDTVQRSGDKIKGKSRHFHAEWFYKALPNGEKVLRKWMVYSPIKKSLYCFCCKLFTHHETKQSFVNGFNSWWKLNPKVSEHENSEGHLSCFEKWKILENGLRLQKTIDHEHQMVLDQEKKKWRDILSRLLDVILFLARQNLPLRGHREGISSDNRGNFLELVNLLSKYDPVLKEHMIRIEHAIACTKSKRVDSYLSKDIQNEFISLLGREVKNNILDDIKKAKYFGIIFDSTPDISHVDQMSYVIRYVHIEGDQVEVKESFLGFFSIAGKTAVELTENILTQLKSDNLDIHLCRAQGYDNAATMAGVHGGVQSIIKEHNPKALFMPCANHSLNLCGVHSFRSVSSSVTFFGTVERVYTFFSSSTHRWEILMKSVGVSVKRLVETRWSAHHDAVKSLKNNFETLVSTLEDMCDPRSSRENVDTREAASTLLPALCDFSFLCYLSFWCEILEEVNETQKYIQTSGLSLEKCVIKIKALKIFLQTQRIQIVERAISYATEKCEDLDISVERRGRRRFRKRMPGEMSQDVGLTLPEELHTAMLECLDRFYEELEHRYKAMDDILITFGVVQSETLLTSTEEELRDIVPNLTKIYDEFSAEDIILEILRLRRHLEAASISLQEAIQWTTLELLKFIVKWDYSESVPSLALCLRFFLTICVSVATCERSFSKLKLIKSYLRSTMSQTRLSSLSILSIEKERKVNFDNVIEYFSKIKSRKHV